MKRKPELEVLEDRRLLTATLPRMPPPVHVSGAPPAATLMAAGAPGGTLSILGLADHPSASPVLPRGGLRGNHNQTLTRVRHRKGRSR
jgi:hypothetical protein